MRRWMWCSERMDRKAEEEAIAELSATTTTPRAAVLDAAGAAMSYLRQTTGGVPCVTSAGPIQSNRGFRSKGAPYSGRPGQRREVDATRMSGKPRSSGRRWADPAG